MDAVLLILAAVSAAMWWGLVLAPWQPWRTREFLEAEDGEADGDLSDVTVLIPARDEAAVIEQTLQGVTRQGGGIHAVLIDDGSTDGTVDRAGRIEGLSLELIHGEPLPDGWVGKLWALEQGRLRAETPFTLLLDADIELHPGTVAALKRKMQEEGRQFVSLMAELSMSGFWEKLLMPAFVFFFKLLYPFGLSNKRESRVAAAAGGCVMMETQVLERAGAFESIRSEIIDDCALAREVKRAGFSTWIGMTRSARSIRPYEGLGGVWNMVARTAFTQLRFSAALLVLCTVLMVLSFVIPVVSLGAGDLKIVALGALAVGGMVVTFLPTLRFYGQSPVWALTLPASGTLYLAMTWTSAWRYWRGDRSRWKGRVYREND